MVKPKLPLWLSIDYQVFTLTIQGSAVDAIQATARYFNDGWVPVGPTLGFYSNLIRVVNSAVD